LQIPFEQGREALAAADRLPEGSLLQWTTTASDGGLLLSFHPLFLYEAVWSFVAFIALFWLYTSMRDRFRPGDFLLLYIAQYSVIRFLLEFIRLEVTLVGDTNLAQIVTGLAFVVSAGLLAYRLSTRGQDERSYDEIAPPVWPEKPAEQPDKPRKRARKTTDETPSDTDEASESTTTA
jgi:prolipoprotein diacylglyceryltransferase